MIRTKIFPNFAKRHNPKDSRILANPKEDKPKETHTKTYHKFLKPKDKGKKSLESCKRNTLPTRKKPFK